MRKAIDTLLFSGDFTPTTFDLAFFMHTLFRDDMDHESRAIDEARRADYREFLESGAEAPRSGSGPVLAPVPATTEPVLARATPPEPAARPRGGAAVGPRQGRADAPLGRRPRRRCRSCRRRSRSAETGAGADRGERRSARAGASRRQRAAPAVRGAVPFGAGSFADVKPAEHHVEHRVEHHAPARARAVRHGRRAGATPRCASRWGPRRPSRPVAASSGSRSAAWSWRSGSVSAHGWS